jgi:hypothetical protein
MERDRVRKIYLHKHREGEKEQGNVRERKEIYRRKK